MEKKLVELATYQLFLDHRLDPNSEEFKACKLIYRAFKHLRDITNERVLTPYVNNISQLSMLMRSPLVPISSAYRACRTCEGTDNTLAFTCDHFFHYSCYGIYQTHMTLIFNRSITGCPICYYNQELKKVCILCNEGIDIKYMEITSCKCMFHSYCLNKYFREFQDFKCPECDQRCLYTRSFFKDEPRD